MASRATNDRAFSQKPSGSAAVLLRPATRRVFSPPFTVPSNKGQGLKIGAGARAPWGYFKGKIDDVCIYDNALSAEELLKLYQEAP
jgi:hypothetical protein